MKIAHVINLAPRKLGSLEDWLIAVVQEGVRRGHVHNVFARRPVHADVSAVLRALGTEFATIDALEAVKLTGVQRLAAYDVIHINLFQPRTVPALMSYAAWPAKVVIVDHTSGPSESDRNVSGARRAVSHALDMITLCRVQQLVGVSEYVRRRDERRFSLKPARTRVIYNGVDIQRFSPRIGDRAPGPLRVVCVANLIPAKGVDVLIRAVDKMQDAGVQVSIVGDGEQAEKLRQLVGELRLDHRVTFLGLRDDVPELLRNSDILVHPAIWQEAFGLTIAEAMSCGCAVVASATGGIPEIIEHGVSGLLTNPGDPDSLARTLDRLTETPSLRASLGAGARDRVEKLFSLDRCAREHVDCIEQAGLSKRSLFAKLPTAGRESR